jgi:hypothetical protein
LTVQIIHKNCDPTLADDKSLPYTAYIVKYYENDQYCYDIVICNKKVDIFDYYWDRYREDLVSFKQTQGRVNPRTWCPKNGKKK